MKISVKVKPGAKKEKIEALAGGSLAVWVREKPQDGKANYAVREALAGHFNVSRSKVVLLKGDKSKDKVFEILR